MNICWFYVLDHSINEFLSCHIASLKWTCSHAKGIKENFLDSFWCFQLCEEKPEAHVLELLKTHPNFLLDVDLAVKFLCWVQIDILYMLLFMDTCANFQQLKNFSFLLNRECLMLKYITFVCRHLNYISFVIKSYSMNYWKIHIFVNVGIYHHSTWKRFTKD